MLQQPTQNRTNRMLAACAWVFFAAFTSPVSAAEPVRLWKATPARPYVLRGAERRLHDRAEQFAVDGQWEDAVEALMRLLESESSSVVALDDQLYISLPEYCHRVLAQFPPKSLARYRQLVDATAETWYRQGIENRDSELLQRVVDQYFCSTWGDDALWALGELALQRGDYQAARNAWLRMDAYPDTDFSSASLQARLTLISIREEDWERAESELAELRADNPTAMGRLGGRDGVLAELLAGLLKQARQEPRRVDAQEVPIPKGACELLWSQPLENEKLTISPLVVDDRLIYQDATSVRSLKLADGEQVFQAKGKVFRSPGLSPASLASSSTESLGQPHFTLTANDRFLFGVTTVPLGLRRKSNGSNAQSRLWSLDLQRDGALALDQPSEEAGVAFVGAPVAAGMQLFVPIRSHDQTARVGIACYDLSTGQRRWQRWLCQANTPATGWTNEIASNLLAYDSGILYANTNLGAIGAVRAADGQVLWLKTYE